MAKNDIKSVGCRIMLQSIVNARKLDVLDESQIRLFVNKWMEFEHTQYVIHLKDITSLRIDAVENFKDKCCHIVYFRYTAMKINYPLSGKFEIPHPASL